MQCLYKWRVANIFYLDWKKFVCLTDALHHYWVSDSSCCHWLASSSETCSENFAINIQFSIFQHIFACTNCRWTCRILGSEPLITSIWSIARKWMCCKNQNSSALGMLSYGKTCHQWIPLANSLLNWDWVTLFKFDQVTRRPLMNLAVPGTSGISLQSAINACLYIAFPNVD